MWAARSVGGICVRLLSWCQSKCHGPLTRYVKLRVAHAPEMAGTFSPQQTSKETASYPGKHRGTCITHVPWCISGSLTRGGGENVTDIFSWRMRNPQFYVSGKRPAAECLAHWPPLFVSKGVSESVTKNTKCVIKINFASTSCSHNSHMFTHCYRSRLHFILTIVPFIYVKSVVLAFITERYKIACNISKVYPVAFIWEQLHKTSCAIILQMSQVNFLHIGNG